MILFLVFEGLRKSTQGELLKVSNVIRAVITVIFRLAPVTGPNNASGGGVKFTWIKPGALAFGALSKQHSVTRTPSTGATPTRNMTATRH